MADDPLSHKYFSMPEVRAAAERLVFEHGGWLEVAARIGMTRDALKHRFAKAQSVVEARGWLSNLRNTLAPK